jgi:hypothetical protein
MTISRDLSTRNHLNAKVALALDKYFNERKGTIRCLDNFLIVEGDIKDEDIDIVKRIYCGPITWINTNKLNNYFSDKMRPRMELLPMDALIAVSYIQSFGAVKHGPNSWKTQENGEAFFLGAALRHISKYSMGDIYDESGMLNLAHACCDLLYSLSFELQKNNLHKEGDDLIETVKKDLKSSKKIVEDNAQLEFNFEA